MKKNPKKEWRSCQCGCGRIFWGDWDPPPRKSREAARILNAHERNKAKKRVRR